MNKDKVKIIVVESKITETPSKRRGSRWVRVSYSKNNNKQSSKWICILWNKTACVTEICQWKFNKLQISFSKNFVENLFESVYWMYK